MCFFPSTHDLILLSSLCSGASTSDLPPSHALTLCCWYVKYSLSHTHTVLLRSSLVSLHSPHSLSSLRDEAFSSELLLYLRTFSHTHSLLLNTLFHMRYALRLPRCIGLRSARGGLSESPLSPCTVRHWPSPYTHTHILVTPSGCVMELTTRAIPLPCSLYS